MASISGLVSDHGGPLSTVARLAAASEHDQRAARRYQGTETGDRGSAGRIGQRLQRHALDDQVICLSPVSWRGHQVGDAIADGGLREALPARRRSR